MRSSCAATRRLVTGLLLGCCAGSSIASGLIAERPPPERTGIGIPLLSDLPLDGELFDRVGQVNAQFERPSVAFKRNGESVNADTPRFETIAIASGYEWSAVTRSDVLYPIAVLRGKLWATNGWNIAVSEDGETFEERFVFPETLHYRASAFETPAGSLLVATGWYQRGVCTVWRSDDEGRTFEPVLTVQTGYLVHFSHSNLYDYIFLAEYGPLTGDNARRIYRSTDDGRTWEVVYDPPPELNYHNHQPIGDEWSNHVYVAFGDHRKGILASNDFGDTWYQLHDHYAPTAGIARPDGVYWGLEGTPPGAVVRFDPRAGQWSHRLRLNSGYIEQYARTRVPWVWSMIDHAGIIYAPFAREGNEMRLSADGENWAFGWGMPRTDAGVFHLAGVYQGWAYGLYGRGLLPSFAPEEHQWFRFRIGDVATIGALRIEPPASNRLADEARSSFEEDESGWVAQGDAILFRDNFRPYHGQSCIRVIDPNRSAAMRILTPAAEEPFPADSWVYARIALRGDETTFKVYLLDEESAEYGWSTVTMPSDDWYTVKCRMFVRHPNNRVRMVIEANAESDFAVDYWFDALEYTTVEDGRTWQPGGVDRAAESLRVPIEFSQRWSDFICFTPEFSTEDVYPGPLTIKSWVQDFQNFARLVVDPREATISVLETLDGIERRVVQTPPIEFWADWTMRIGVISAETETRLHVRIGTEHYEAIGEKLELLPRELQIGSSPLGNDQAPGLYALSRTYAGELSRVEALGELHFLPQARTGRIQRGDANCDQQVDFLDLDLFVFAFMDQRSGRDGYLSTSQAAACWSARSGWGDVNEDGQIDFEDLTLFVDCLVEAGCR